MLTAAVPPEGGLLATAIGCAVLAFVVVVLVVVTLWSIERDERRRSPLRPDRPSPRTYSDWDREARLSAEAIARRRGGLPSSGKRGPTPLRDDVDSIRSNEGDTT